MCNYGFGFSQAQFFGAQISHGGFNNFSFMQNFWRMANFQRGGRGNFGQNSNSNGFGLGFNPFNRGLGQNNNIFGLTNNNFQLNRPHFGARNYMNTTASNPFMPNARDNMIQSGRDSNFISTGQNSNNIFGDMNNKFTFNCNPQFQMVFA